MSNVKKIQSSLFETVEPVNRFIDNLLLGGKPPKLYEASRHLVMAGGKRLRPYLTIKSCQASGGNAKDAVPFAAALEILHNFTLIHDDVMDHDDFRRGEPTVHRKFGEPMAILAGDLLFSKVYQSVLDFSPGYLSSDAIITALRRMTDAITLLCEGQALDISYPTAADVTEDDYIYMIGAKTSALFKACAEVGAIAAGASSKVIDALGRFAWNAGLAFQITDDILGLTADESTLGKPVGSDLREGKKTLIMIHGLNNADASQLVTLKSAMRWEEASDGDIENAVFSLKEIGSIRYAKNEALKYTQEAFESLKTLKDTAAKEELIELVKYFAIREY